MRIEIYNVTDEDRKIITDVVLKMVNCMEGLSISQKAFALKVLTDGFTKMTGVNSIYIDGEEDGYK